MVRFTPAWQLRKEWAETAMKILAEGAASAAQITGEEIDLAGWAFAVTESVSDHGHRARALAGVGSALASNGMRDQAMLLFRVALNEARLGGRDAVLEVVTHAAETIAAIDDGETLWNIYEDLVKSDEWLFAQPDGSSTATPAAQSGQAPGSQRS